MQWKPNVTVAAIAEKNGSFLIVEEEADNHVVFNQPAGHLEKNETLIDAVKREVMEETAWEFAPKSIIGFYIYPNSHIDIVYLRVCFHGICIKHFPNQSLDEGILRTVWLTRDELEKKRDKMRSPMVLTCIDDYLAGKAYPLEILNHYISNN
jgi:ADP-ribose pyrophosphatase YjhB (NUDIX family)